jgi:hypothetical protein
MLTFQELDDDLSVVLSSIGRLQDLITNQSKTIAPLM